MIFQSKNNSNKATCHCQAIKTIKILSDYD